MELWNSSVKDVIENNTKIYLDENCSESMILTDVVNNIKTSIDNIESKNINISLRAFIFVTFFQI
mgnify:CR=1 FL=1